MRTIKVSVIVPVYNTGKFLKKCLDSILFQTLDEIEIILINDGSSDNSHEICIEYATKYGEKIKYLKNENIGCSATRNLGLSLVKGEYIGFVDSDDFIEKKMYEKMYKKAILKDSDVVISGVIYQSKENKFIPNLKSDSELIDFLNPKTRLAFCWNKIYKATMIQENKILFPENTHYAEDLVFTYKALINSKKINFLNDAFYNYIIHGENSILSFEKRLGFFQAFDELYDYLFEYNFLSDKVIKKMFYKNLEYHIKLLFWLFINYKDITNKEYEIYNRLFLEKLNNLDYINLEIKFKIFYYSSLIKIIRKFKLYFILKKIKGYLK